MDPNATVIQSSVIIGRYLSEYIRPSGLTFADANRAKSVDQWAAEQGFRPVERSDSGSPYGYVAIDKPESRT